MLATRSSLAEILCAGKMAQPASTRISARLKLVQEHRSSVNMDVEPLLIGTNASDSNDSVLQKIKARSIGITQS